jgi:hypothetical protein
MQLPAAEKKMCVPSFKIAFTKSMAIWVVKFSREGYKIKYKSTKTYSKAIIVFSIIDNSVEWSKIGHQFRK